MPVVPPELGVGSLERGVTVGLGLLDTALPLYQLLVLNNAFTILRVVDGLSADSWRVRWRRVMRTRFGGSSWTGCAGTSSWILHSCINILAVTSEFLSTYWPWRRLLLSIWLCGIVEELMSELVEFALCLWSPVSE